jgi:hypothetical protein
MLLRRCGARARGAVRFSLGARRARRNPHA